MNEIIKQLDSALNSCQAKEKELNVLIAQNKQELNNTLDKQKALVEKDAELSAREKAVAHIENTVAILEEAKALSAKTAEEMKELKIQRDAFIATRENAEQEISAKMRAAIEKENAVKAAEEDVNAKLASLEDQVLSKVKQILKKD